MATSLNSLAGWALLALGAAGLTGLAALAWIWAVQKLLRALRMNRAIAQYLCDRNGRERAQQTLARRQRRHDDVS